MNIALKNIKQLVTVSANEKKIKRGNEMRELNIIENAGLIAEEGKIKWLGTMNDFPKNLSEDLEILGCENCVVMPGFVDAHTHLIFGGSRESEFAMRSSGATYQEIAASGGGIISTVSKTREATKLELKKRARHYLSQMLKHGTTTVETKSGYGLDFKNEIKLLECARELEREELTTIVSTFLGAHSFPLEYKERKSEYVQLVMEEMIPYIGGKKLAEFCDVFCETNYFSVDDTRKILSKAKEYGMKLKLHAEELSNLGGAELAAELNAVSVDHLEHISENGIRALQNSETVAVLLPGVSFNLNHQYAPARTLIDAQIPVAIASDFNPGSCMSYSMPLMMTIACTQMRMSPEEVIVASTLNAAAAIARSKTIGSLEVGKNADIIVLDIPNYKFLPYHFGENHVRNVIKNGVQLDF
ncbi:MAG: imidazolonepropionase [Ignavibacteriales bacterium]|nr:imidazolonepropionase [Ignavibacteriales bacterium]